MSTMIKFLSPSMSALDSSQDNTLSGTGSSEPGSNSEYLGNVGKQANHGPKSCPLFRYTFNSLPQLSKSPIRSKSICHNEGLTIVTPTSPRSAKAINSSSSRVKSSVPCPNSLAPNMETSSPRVQTQTPLEKYIKTSSLSSAISPSKICQSRI